MCFLGERALAESSEAAGGSDQWALQWFLSFDAVRWRGGSALWEWGEDTSITGCEAPIYFHNVMSGHPLSPFSHTQQTLGHMDWLFCSISAQLTVKDVILVAVFCTAVIKIVKASSHNSNRHFVGFCHISVTPVGVCWCWLVLVCRVVECQRSDVL